VTVVAVEGKNGARTSVRVCRWAGCRDDRHAPRKRVRHSAASEASGRCARRASRTGIPERMTGEPVARCQEGMEPGKLRNADCKKNRSLLRTPRRPWTTACLGRSPDWHFIADPRLPGPEAGSSGPERTGSMPTVAGAVPFRAAPGINVRMTAGFPMWPGCSGWQTTAPGQLPWDLPRSLANGVPWRRKTR